MRYYSNTFNSKNFLVRFAHRRRLSTALSQINMDVDPCLLDFGAGDGLFLNELAQRLGQSPNIFGYEPYMETLQGNKTAIYRDWKEVEAHFKDQGKADIVTCFEVLEHFTSYAQEEALEKIRGVLSDDGLVVISVPIESGLPSLVKNLIRRLRYGKGGSGVYSMKNIVRSLFELPIPEHRNQGEYLPYMGFYFRDIEAVFRKLYTIKSRSYSPFPALGSQFNSQVFYKLAPNPSGKQAGLTKGTGS